MYKIVIDANLWISLLIGKRLSGLKKLCFNENISIITSPKMVEEFIDVSSREKIKKYATPQNISNVLSLIKACCVDDPIEDAIFPSLNDPKDLYLFALANANDADFLLTGDKPLLALGRFHQTRIISYSKFMAMLEEEA